MDSELKKVGEGKRKRKVFKRERKGRNEMVKIQKKKNDVERRDIKVMEGDRIKEIKKVEDS